MALPYELYAAIFSFIEPSDYATFYALLTASRAIYADAIVRLYSCIRIEDATRQTKFLQTTASSNHAEIVKALHITFPVVPPPAFGFLVHDALVRMRALHTITFTDGDTDGRPDKTRLLGLYIGIFNTGNVPCFPHLREFRWCGYYMRDKAGVLPFLQQNPSIEILELAFWFSRRKIPDILPNLRVLKGDQHTLAVFGTCGEGVADFEMTKNAAFLLFDRWEAVQGIRRLTLPPITGRFYTEETDRALRRMPNLEYLRVVIDVFDVSFLTSYVRGAGAHSYSLRS